MRTRWDDSAAAEWGQRQPWLVGCNFIPSTAINQLEMWQAESFDPPTIERELAQAASLGFNVVRVYLHDLLWEQDAAGFGERLGRFLDAAQARGLGTLLVLFDDCWNKDPRLGKQTRPVSGVHNYGWVQSPGEAAVRDPAGWARLERYVVGIVSAFRQDRRVLGWDVYNEPGNQKLGEASVPLLERAFAWARAGGPEQPLTSGVWSSLAPAIRELQLAASDIISFHNYNGVDELRSEIVTLKQLGRPVLCTEYLARGRGSRFQTHLPVFKAEGVGCLNWGLVSGKTQTIYPWGSPAGAPEPKVWHHDIFRPDGTPFDRDEVAFIRSATGAARATT